MKYVFGPVPSRRLGLSLGVDLTPPKTCTYDCLYCQLGRTTCKTIEPKDYVPMEAVLTELGETLSRVTPDYVTFSGSGEPTLHVEIGRAIDYVKDKTDAKVAVLTNGSLLYRPEIRQRICRADLIMPTLTTVREKTFRMIHQPHERLDLNEILDGLRSLRKSYRGKLFVEVMLLAGLNDQGQEIEALQRAMEEIAPDGVHLNTVERPPADDKAIPLDRRKMEDIRIVLGPCAEIIAEGPIRKERFRPGSLASAVLEMAKRHPVTAKDVAQSLDVRVDEAERTMKAMADEGNLRRRTHRGKDYYTG